MGSKNERFDHCHETSIGQRIKSPCYKEGGGIFVGNTYLVLSFLIKYFCKELVGIWEKDSEQNIRRRGNLNRGWKVSQHDEYNMDIRKKCFLLISELNVLLSIELKVLFL